MNGTASSDGWTASLRRVGDSVKELIRGRFELFIIELQEEKLRLISLVVWLGVALLLGAVGVLAGVAALAVWLWNVAGYLGLIALGVVALGAAAGILVSVRRKIINGPAPFSEFAAEFRKDRECLRAN